MAKFLDTTGVSYHLQQLINNAEDKLYLISPYLKFNQRIKQSLEHKNLLKKDIRLIYGKNELQPNEHNWLKDLTYIKSSFCENLHAKCYLSEKEAIITSMNLYEFSEVNNNEMGIHVSRDEDLDLYKDIYDEVQRLILVSDEIKISVSKVPKKVEQAKKPFTKAVGFCIHCHNEIALDPQTPYCKKCYNVWKKYGNEEYEEKHCHICGKPNKSMLIKPTCYDCYKANKNNLEFPISKS